MRCQVLASGSGGNATLVRAGELTVLVDAGLTPSQLRDRFEAARLPYRAIDHVLVTHGHLDHARSAGAVARRHGATLHCAPGMMRHRSVRRAPRLCAIRIGSVSELRHPAGDVLTYLPIALPHDCDPTVAYRLEHGGRALAILTDMGRLDEAVARTLRGLHVLVLEFNHDAELLRAGPYSEPLKQRIAGGRGHLDNDAAGRLLATLAGPELHTVVLAHLSAANNTPELACAAARAALATRGREDVRILVASQDEIGENLEV